MKGRFLIENISFKSREIYILSHNICFNDLAHNIIPRDNGQRQIVIYYFICKCKCFRAFNHKHINNCCSQLNAIKPFLILI